MLGPTVCELIDDADFNQRLDLIALFKDKYGEQTESEKISG